MYENREAILEECGDELTKVENTLEVLQANGSWFCFLLMVVLGIHLGQFLIFQAQHPQEGLDGPDLNKLAALEELDVFDLAKIFARGLETEGEAGVAH